MRLHRIRVEHVRGLEAAEVVFDVAGVTVIEAPNESGKTTLFDALDHLLTEKDSTRKQPIKDLQPVGRDVGSLVEAELTCGAIHLTIRKRFNKERMTELQIHAPTPRRLTGDDAHDALRQVIGDHTDVALYEALRFRQGRALDSVALGTSSSLAARLDDIAGGGGQSTDDVLLDRIRAEYLRYFTPSGLEGRPLKELASDLRDAEERVAGLADHARELEQDADRLAELDRETRRLRTVLDEAEPMLAEHRESLERVRSIRDDLQTRVALAEVADAGVDRAQRDVADRRALVEAIEQDAADLAVRLPELERAHERLLEQEARLDALASAVVAAEDRERMTREQVQFARAMAELGRGREEVAGLRARQARIDAALDAAGTAEAFLDAHPLDEGDLHAIRVADDALRLAVARLGDAAPVVSLRALAGPFPVVIDGDEEKLGTDAPIVRPIPERILLQVPDLVEIEVRAGSSLAERQQDVDGARQRLQAACAVVDVGDRVDAEALAEQRRIHGRVIAERDATIERELAGMSREQLRDRIRTRSAQLLELEQQVASVSQDDAAVAQLSLQVDAIGDRLLALEADEVRTRTAAAEARRAHAGAAPEVARLRSDVRTAQSMFETDERQLDERRARLGSLRGEVGDDDLAAALSERQEQAAAAHAAVASSQAELNRLKADEVELLAANAEQRVNRAHEQLRSARDEATERRARIEVRGGDGVGEALLAAEAERDRLQDASTRLMARATAAKTLHDAFERARDAAYAAYRTPLRERIVQAGRIVFNDTLDVELDEQLRVVARHLDGVALDWDQLSAGAREQLAILTALAAADLAGGDGEGGVPLVLDDTLGYTDPARLERLCAVLGRIRGPQVIVLTCVGERFQGIGAATVVRLRETLVH